VIQKLIKEKIEKKEDKSSLCSIYDSALLDSEDSEVLLDELELNLNLLTNYKENNDYNKQNASHSHVSSNLLLFQKQIDQYEG
jgi:hypothetical protein